MKCRKAKAITPQMQAEAATLQAKQKKRKQLKTALAILLPITFLVAGICLGVILANAAQRTITITYQAGSYGEGTQTDLFTDFTVSQQTTVSDTLILPGTTFAENVSDARLLNQNNTPRYAKRLDGETFYFGSAPEGGSYSQLWAYSFTGWKIVHETATEKLPGETVFQPGDVITPDILTKYAQGDALTLEAVWGKCYFIQNPYAQMKYKIDETSGNIAVVDTNQSTGKYENVSDQNLGNDPENPKATIDGLFLTLRATLAGKTDQTYNNSADFQTANQNPAAYDAYGTVVMLTGNLDYYTNTHQTESSKIFGYAVYPGNTKYTAYTSVTFKSLMAQQSEPYLFSYKPKGYSNPIYGSLRFDNVKYSKIPMELVASDAVFSKQDRGSEYQLYFDGNAHTFNNLNHYFETTARMEGDEFSTFRPNQYEYVVLNSTGSSRIHMQNQYSSSVEGTKPLTWVVGRNAKIEIVTCGITSVYQDNFANIRNDYNVKVVGGSIRNLHGGNRGINSIAAGNRNIMVLGDKSGNTQYDPEITGGLYGASYGGRLYADVSLTIDGCSNIANVYGGGETYSATTYGDIQIQITNSVITGNLYGGGQFGNCEKTPSTYLQYRKDSGTQEIYSTEEPLSNLFGGKLEERIGKGGAVTVQLIDSHVKGNIFGSGMGASQTLETSYSVRKTDTTKQQNDENQSGWKHTQVYPTIEDGAEWDWSKPLSNYPSYDTANGRVLVKAYRRATWTVNSSDDLPFYNSKDFAYLSLATVEKVSIDIQGSTVGTTTTNGKGNVYGGGSIAKVLGNTEINISKDSVIYGNVFGGGDGVTIPDQVKVYRVLEESEYTAPTYTVHWKANGTLDSVTFQEQSPAKGIPTTNPYELYTWSGAEYLLGAEYNGIDKENKLLYSPNTNGLGSVAGSCTVTIDDSTVHKSVYGGGNHGTVGGNTSVTLENTVVKQNAFGGGNGDTAATDTSLKGAVSGNSSLTIGGEVKKDVINLVGMAFGGCNAADVTGHTTLTISGGRVHDAYGANNLKGSIGGQVTANLEGGEITNHLFAGGNQADYAGIPKLIITGGAVGDVGSGQNAGGTVTGTAFGGGNKAAVAGTHVEVSNADPQNPPKLRSLIGGGYAANVGYANNADPQGITIELLGGSITTFLAGNDHAGEVFGNISVTVGSSTAIDQNNDAINVRNFFGGGNSANYKYGENWTPTVSPEHDDMSDPNFQGVSIDVYSGRIYQLFGGGVLASISNARLAIHGGVFHFVYGGGYRGDATNTAIHMRGGLVKGKFLEYGQTTDPTDEQGGYVFGGGYGGYVRNANVHLEGTGTHIEHSLFGGGYSANTAWTSVIIKSGTVIGSVYGGGFAGKVGYDKADVVQTRTVTAADGTVTTEYGSTYMELTGGSIGASSTGDSGNTYIGNIYGGGYQGEVYQAHVDACEWRFPDQSEELELGGNIYGGGHEADVEFRTRIHVISTNIQGSIFGGGRDGNVNGSTHVDVLCGNIGGSIYGGGENGTVVDTHVLVSDKISELNKVTGRDLSVDFPEIQEQNIVINLSGNVFGGGYGATATVKNSTSVVVDLIYNFEAIETPVEVGENTSGEIETQIDEIEQTGDSPYSQIVGSVYGGGDLGMVGEGSINPGSNTATVTNAGTTTVTVRSGHILESVFGGGNGAPKTGAYNVHMGAVFGSTQTNIWGGYIETNVYGGGKQSRLYYAPTTRATALAAEVNIDQNHTSEGGYGTIAIGKSVFGGGDRGSNVASTNASVPTTVGNVQVNIIGNASAASTIYFCGDGGEGGVYGDGNLCLVNGYREVVMTNFNAGTDKTKLKTFYSLQRADRVTMTNTAVVLLGAIDLVEEGDDTIYSINRVGELLMKNGSTFKLDQVVKYLSHLESDIETDRVFIDKGHNGENDYFASGGSDPSEKLTPEEIEAYRNGTVTYIVEDNASQNTVCVANGLFLEMRNADGSYGTVTGLFTLQLLRANPGEGGGFVYADIEESTGDFICVTRRGFDYHVKDFVAGSLEDEFDPNTTYYIRTIDGYVEYQVPIDPDTKPSETGLLFYIRYDNTSYMDVVDTVGGKIGSVFTYYYWYINGPIVEYNVNVVGFIGSEETTYSDEKVIPAHDARLRYSLFDLDLGEDMKNALVGSDHKYTLVHSNTNLVNQEIAIELRLGDQSLGFLYYTEKTENGKTVYEWGIWKSETNVLITGYEGHTNLVEANRLIDTAVSSKNDKVKILLHKSKDVNYELTTMDFNMVIDLYILDVNGNTSTAYNEGSSTLIFKNAIKIVRLVPIQSVYYHSERRYAGINESEQVAITAASSFSVEYQTKYIPSAFPITTEAQIQWILSANKYNYYFDETLGAYLTLGEGGVLVNKSASLSYALNDLDDDATERNHIYQKEGDDRNYYYRTEVTNEGGATEVKEIQLKYDEDGSTEKFFFPKNTRITLVDRSNNTATSGFYYYICKETCEEINLMDFLQMGTNTKIRDLTGDAVPVFLKGYQAQETARFSEMLNLIIDFSQVNWAEAGISFDESDVKHDFSGLFFLKHFYNGVDIMDYVNKDEKTGTFNRSTPQKMTYAVDLEEDGLKEESLNVEFGKPSYYDKDTADFKISFSSDDTWDNTRLGEGKFSLKIEMVESDADNAPTLEMPTGISFHFDGKVLYAGEARRYAVIPVADFGEDHNIVIRNDLQSLKEAAGGNKVYFRVTLYSAPDANYYFTDQEYLIGVGSYTILDNPVYSLTVTPDAASSNRVLQAGEELKLQASAAVDVEAVKADAVLTVQLQKKSENGVYEDISWGDVFTATTPDLAMGNNSLTLTINNAAEAGSYRLLFILHDSEIPEEQIVTLKEALTFIVR